MSKQTVQLDSYLNALDCFHWATKRHFLLWFTGQTRTRHRRTESVLNRLTKNGQIVCHWYDGKKNYTKKRPITEIVHGLACTECLVRFYRADPFCIIVPERYFKKLGSVPEWGIIYPSGKMICFEFCTESNYLHTGTMRGKLNAYRRNLTEIEQKFQTEAIVVFVIDISRSAVERFVGSLGGVPPRSNGDTFPEPFYFTDYETFLKVAIGEQLKAPIYFWTDGEEYPLR